MDADDYRNNPQNLDDKVDAQNGDRSAKDVEREKTEDTNVLDVAKERHGLDHGELKQHSQEFHESAGQILAPTVDPPKTPDPEEDTAPPQ